MRAGLYLDIGKLYCHAVATYCIENTLKCKTAAGGVLKNVQWTINKNIVNI
jgi:hypothetical protein